MDLEELEKVTNTNFLLSKTRALYFRSCLNENKVDLNKEIEFENSMIRCLKNKMNLSDHLFNRANELEVFNLQHEKITTMFSPDDEE